MTVGGEADAEGDEVMGEDTCDVDWICNLGEQGWDMGDEEDPENMEDNLQRWVRLVVVMRVGEDVSKMRGIRKNRALSKVYVDKIAERAEGTDKQHRGRRGNGGRGITSTHLRLLRKGEWIACKLYRKCR